jgi:hypothetical protein
VLVRAFDDGEARFRAEMKGWAQAQRQLEKAFGAKRTADMRALLHALPQLTSAPRRLVASRNNPKRCPPSPCVRDHAEASDFCALSTTTCICARAPLRQDMIYVSGSDLGDSGLDHERRHRQSPRTAGVPSTPE